ncbi:MAG TPA: MAB_1171c family putative transporter [Streptomyces sp.]|uniref:MAB_1171c family putative transporter n=1 Tax=Streptomyces sp. TaxID=1931 RepID=UPI002D08A477|nr:MAB_1171c family putative transporter [Streptomyces sp.]HWU10813.1 MAB_1171c family putative transporter [Streptomyces sp.]
MKDILHPICLIIAGLGFLLLLRDLKKNSRDAALILLSLVYLSSALSFAISITPIWIRIDSTLGVTNIAVPLAQSCVILVLVFQTSVLAHWALPAQEARRRTRLFGLAGLAVIVGMFVLFAFLTPAVQRTSDFATYYVHDPAYKAYLTLYMAAYTAAEIYLGVVCWRHARHAGNVWVVRGLRTITVGAVVIMGYCAIRIGGILGDSFGFSVARFKDIAWFCGDVGALLTLIGYFLPTLMEQVEDARSWSRDQYALWRLEPLWRALHAVAPTIALMSPPSQWQELVRFRSVRFLLYRRVTEIRDGMIELRPYLDPQVRAIAETRLAGQGLQDPDLAAAVTAEQISQAISSLTRGQDFTEPAEYADARLSIATTQEDMQAQLRIAAHFAPPAVSTPTAQRPARSASRAGDEQ